MLQIEGLHVAIGETVILRGLDLEVPSGEVHAVMGPNGSGKSTLAHVLTGREPYRVTAGTVRFADLDLLTMRPKIGLLQACSLPFSSPSSCQGSRPSIFSERRLMRSDGLEVRTS